MIDQIRTDAARRFNELGFPTTKLEEWRFTNVAPIARTRFAPAPLVRNGWKRDGDLLFVNGHFVEQGSRSAVGRLTTAPPQGLQRHLGRYASYEQHAFVALNTASFQDGAFIEVPKGAVLEEPIHIVFASTGGGTPWVSHPRNLIVVGENAQVTILETYIGDGAEYFTNAVTEIVAADNAVVDHYKLQLEDERAYHIASLQAQVGRGASFSSHSISLGGGLVRNDVNAVLSEGSQATVNGFYLATGTQLVDNHTAIDHAKPHGTSHELYKGILDGKAAAVFNGKILVRKDAQKTDAKQTNKNLVLSEDATINTKPELQIYADDVRCTHGATIGQLDADAIFYLQSRGIPKEQARSLLIHAFARDIIQRVPVAPLRDRLEQVLFERLHAYRN